MTFRERCITRPHRDNGLEARRSCRLRLLHDVCHEKDLVRTVHAQMQGDLAVATCLALAMQYMGEREIDMDTLLDLKYSL